MVKQRYIGVAAGSLVAVVLLGGGGVWLWHGHPHNRQLGQQLDTLQSAAANASGPASQNSIPLNQTTGTPSANSGLSVNSSSPANGLGQTNGNQGQSGGTANSSSGGSAANNTFDPASFTQYDKYKTNTGALFGDVQKGTGTALSASHKAAVLYRGWLTSGQLFDESKAGSDGKYQPFVFTEGAHQVIPGWEQGLDGMKVGGVRLLIVPPAVGYGASGQGSIPPNSVLIFQVQLLDVQ